jgi:hypothetical protein
MPDIILPTLHPGQVDIFNAARTDGCGKYIVRCGRRWGKTTMMDTLAGDSAAKGRKVGLFAPEHKQLNEPYENLRYMLLPIIRPPTSRTDGVIRTTTNGGIDFWATDDNELAGRGREYHVTCMDEAAFTKKGQMMGIYERSIKPTMLTTRGVTWIFSTPNGNDPENFFFQLCTEPKYGFREFHAPTSSNPYVPADELEKEKALTHPLVWKQEYLAEFVDWGSETFFKLAYFLVNNAPVAYPKKCDAIIVIVDCAVKSGTENDGTGILYCAVSKHTGHPLIWLDYEVHSIDAASLEFLAPLVLKRAEELAVECGARQGSLGMFVEDTAGGSVLIMQAKVRNWPIKALDSKITARGKDERAMLAGGPAFAGMVKVSQYCYDKKVQWKSKTMNHFLHQMTTYRIGDKDAAKRADDLYDCGAYSIIVACADARTF